MTDTFVVTRMSKDPAYEIWRVRNTTAGGANDYVSTRSFVLYALHREGIRLDDDWTELLDTPAGPTAKPYVDHADRFLDRVVFLARRNEQPSMSWPEGTDEAMDARSGSREEDEARLAARFHHVFLGFRMKEPYQRALAGLPVCFGTCAFDWWWNDPTRQERPSTRPSVRYEKLLQTMPKILLGALEAEPRA